MTASLSVQEVARLTQTSENYIRDEIKAGRLSAWKASGYRIEHDDLEAWKQAKKVRDNGPVSLRAIEGGAA